MLPFGFDGFHVWRHRVVNIESYKKKKKKKSISSEDKSSLL
jgi:hypothetical protein